MSRRRSAGRGAFRAAGRGGVAEVMRGQRGWCPLEVPAAGAAPGERSSPVIYGFGGSLEKPAGRFGACRVEESPCEDVAALGVVVAPFKET